MYFTTHTFNYPIEKENTIRDFKLTKYSFTLKLFSIGILSRFFDHPQIFVITLTNLFSEDFALVNYYTSPLRVTLDDKFPAIQVLIHLGCYCVQTENYHIRNYRQSGQTLTPVITAIGKFHLTRFVRIFLNQFQLTSCLNRQIQ